MLFHLKGDGPTVEGYSTRRTMAGHYIVLVPAVKQAEDQTIRLDGVVEIPAANVWFYQVLRDEP
jgi:hypothetical protein